MMGLNYCSIGHRIMVLRKRKGISQSDFSELIDKSPTYISYIENGKKSMSLATFVQIANALRVPADTLLAEQLTGTVLPASQEITQLLADCSDFERLVIADAIMALKASLRAHRPIVQQANRRQF